MEAARSVSEVLALQQILQSENILNSFEGFSEADFGDGVNCQESDEDDCQNNIFEYFCGTLKPSRFFAGLLKYGDSGSSGVFLLMGRWIYRVQGGLTVTLQYCPDMII